MFDRLDRKWYPEILVYHSSVKVMASAYTRHQELIHLSII